MIIKASQFNALGDEMFKQFLNDLTHEIDSEYPDWKSDATFSNKFTTVRNIVEYGQKLNITEADTLKNFTSYLIRFNQQIPLAAEIVNELKNVNIDEDRRVEHLYFELASNRNNLKRIEIY